MARTLKSQRPQSSRNFVRAQSPLEQLEDRQLLAAWYASPTGQASNTGAIDSPWDLATALTKTNVIGPGDTLYLRGGTYYHPNRAVGTKGYGFHLDGAAGSPVTIRPYGTEHAILDGGLQSIDGTVSEHVVITGLEVIVSENLTQTRVSASTGSGAPSDLLRPWGGIDIRSGFDIKILNNVVHANMQGIGMWGSVGGDSEIYGNVVYDNGWIAPDRKHGHGMYAQNATAEWKYVRDNLLFDNYSQQMQAYGSEIAGVDRFYLARNVFWSTGISDESGILIGGLNASETIRIYENVGYEGNLRIGYVDGGNDAIVSGNSIYHGGAQYTQWTNLTRSNNFSWGNNSPPTIDGVQVAPPTTPYTYLYANAYDSKRANVAIQNFPNWTQVAVDPTGFLQIGDTYRLLKPTDMWGAPVLTGTYTGSPINIAISGPFAAYVLENTTGNSAPTISNITNSTVTLGAAVPTKSFTIGDNETSAASLTLSVQSSNSALVPLANLVLGGSGANRTLQVTPTAGLLGSTVITVTVTDGAGLTASDTFTVTVDPPNTAPTITDITNLTLTTDDAIPLRNFTVGDAQTAAGTLTLTKASSNTALVPTANLVFGGSGANRTLQVTPVAGMTGSTTITVTVTDAGGLSMSDQFLLTINPGNVPPTISAIADVTVLVGVDIATIPFTIGDAETAASLLTLTVQSTNTGLLPLSAIVLGGTGANRTVKVNPTAGFQGSSRVTITVSDGGKTAAEQFLVTIVGDSDSPTVVNDAVMTTSNKPVKIDVLKNDSDAGGIDPDSLVITSGPAHGNAWLASQDGTIQYRASSSFQGADTLKYRVRDLQGNLSAEATVTVTVLSGGGGVGGWSRNIYLDVLGRDAASSEIAYWQNVAPAAGRETVAYAFLTSREERAGYIAECYRECLGREVDPAGEEFWLGVWQRTGGPEWIRAGLIGSGEYYFTNGNTDAGAISALYQDILGRSAVAAEVNYWDVVLDHTPLANVAMGFLTSDEYRLGLINTYYQYYLHRDAEAGGGQFWLQRVKQGMSQERLQAVLMASDEYFSFS